jgi:excisionase family DNA binding protein
VYIVELSNTHLTAPNESRDTMAETERLAFSISEAAALLGVGRTHAYAMAKAGDLPTLRLGRRVVVPRAQLEQLLAGDQ